MFELLIVEGEANKELRACTDCGYFKGSLTLWCTNDEAIKTRGTAKGSVYKCPYWKPAKHINDLTKKELRTGYYIEIRQ